MFAGFYILVSPCAEEKVQFVNNHNRLLHISKHPIVDYTHTHTHTIQSFWLQSTYDDDVGLSLQSFSSSHGKCLMIMSDASLKSVGNDG